RYLFLNFEIIKEEDEFVIIGINVVSLVCLYMVYVVGVGFVWVDWDIYTF
ncbi:hypothetical protein B0H65DRAFT_415169, partial [Neurospora tetraspora]